MFVIGISSTKYQVQWGLVSIYDFQTQSGQTATITFDIQQPDISPTFNQIKSEQATNYKFGNCIVYDNQGQHLQELVTSGSYLSQHPLNSHVGIRTIRCPVSSTYPIIVSIQIDIKTNGASVRDSFFKDFIHPYVYSFLPRTGTAPVYQISFNTAYILANDNILNDFRIIIKPTDPALFIISPTFPLNNNYRCKGQNHLDNIFTNIETNPDYAGYGDGGISISFKTSNLYQSFITIQCPISIIFQSAPPPLIPIEVSSDFGSSLYTHSNTVQLTLPYPSTTQPIKLEQIILTSPPQQGMNFDPLHQLKYQFYLITDQSTRTAAFLITPIFRYQYQYPIYVTNCSTSEPNISITTQFAPQAAFTRVSVDATTSSLSSTTPITILCNFYTTPVPYMPLSPGSPGLIELGQLNPFPIATIYELHSPIAPSIQLPFTSLPPPKPQIAIPDSFYLKILPDFAGTTDTHAAWVIDMALNGVSFSPPKISFLFEKEDGIIGDNAIVVEKVIITNTQGFTSGTVQPILVEPVIITMPDGSADIAITYTTTSPSFAHFNPHFKIYITMPIARPMNSDDIYYITPTIARQPIDPNISVAITYHYHEQDDVAFNHHQLFSSTNMQYSRKSLPYPFLPQILHPNTGLEFTHTLTSFPSPNPSIPQHLFTIPLALASIYNLPDESVINTYPSYSIWKSTLLQSQIIYDTIITIQVVKDFNCQIQLEPYFDQLDATSWSYNIIVDVITLRYKNTFTTSFTKTDSISLGNLLFTSIGGSCTHSIKISIQPPQSTPHEYPLIPIRTYARNYINVGLIEASLYNSNSQIQSQQLLFTADLNDPINGPFPLDRIVISEETTIRFILSWDSRNPQLKEITFKLYILNDNGIPDTEVTSLSIPSLTADNTFVSFTTIPTLTTILKPLTKNDYIRVKVTFTALDVNGINIGTGETLPFIIVPQSNCYQEPMNINNDISIIDKWILLCGEHGTCGDNYQCICNSGYIGAQCDKKVCTNNNSFGNECDFYPIQPPPTILPIVDIPPVIIPSLPLQLPLISQRCDLIIDVNQQYQLVQNQNGINYDTMCSIPTSGTLISQQYDVIKLQTTHPQLYQHFQSILPTPPITINICNCLCKGYWIDNPLTLDYKKCTQCEIIPKCQNFMTPNYDCTSCECITPACKKYTTYLFSTIYIKPQLLQFISTILSLPIATTAIPPIEFNTNPTSNDLNTYVYHIAPSIKHQYSTIMNNFSQYLLQQYQHKYNLQPTLYTSQIRDIIITPLIEGLYTAWKITLVLSNNSKITLSPTSSSSQYYGLPILDVTIDELFITYCNSLPIIQSNTNNDGFTPTFRQEFQQYIHTPHIIIPTISTTLPLTQLFTNDIFSTQCLSENDYQLISTNESLFSSTMLKPCPLPQQYLYSNDTNKMKLFNPMWSTCSSSSNSDDNNSLITKFNNYESILLPITTLPTTILSTRRIYPVCIDFTGTNVTKYNIPCDLPLPYYSSQSQQLLSPLYVSLLTSTIDAEELLEISDEYQSAVDRVQTIRSYQLPKFPLFPQSIYTMCHQSKQDGSDNHNNEQQCDFPYYGFECKNEYNFGQNNDQNQSITLSPTHLQLNSHAHISWQYQGDDTHEITLILKSTHTTTRSTQFQWSQILGTFPMSYLYSTPQLPTYSNSTLFSSIYQILHKKAVSPSSLTPHDEALLQLYQSKTNITIQGYLTKKADYNLHQVDSQTPFFESSFELILPMLCDELNITCDESQNQYCNQAIGRCECQYGYIAINDGDDTTTLQCEPLCFNNGQYKIETNTCECNEDISYGKRCEILTTCQNEESNQQCNLINGYIPFDPTTNGCNNDQCICYDHWLDNEFNPLHSSSTTEISKCSYCPLKPFNIPYYTQDELQQLKSLDEKHEIDEQYTQTYQHYHNDNSPQRCYYSGTNTTSFNITAVDENNDVHTILECEKCHCKYGYGGEYCQLHVVYTNFTYQPLPDDQRYDYDENDNNIKSLFYDKFSEELSLSLPFFNKKDIFIQHYYYDLHTVTIGIYTGLDFFERNQQLRLEKQQSISTLSSSFQFNILQTKTNVTLLPTQIDSIYNQWSSLTTNFNNTPIKNQDANQFLGSIDPPQPLHDPACYDQGILGCSGNDPNIKSKKSMTGIIIGIVVAIVVAILLFILIVCILLWCRRNERGLWKSKEQQDKDELSSFTFTQREEYTKSTAAPKSTIGTSSMLPMNAHGVEMSSSTTNNNDSQRTTTTNIQSVNNHTEVNDPTLPSNVKAYKDAKGQIFYVNSETMTTSWKHPNSDSNNNNGTTTGGGGDDYGAGW